MAEIRPFAAIRPAADKVDRIAALPYDVYTKREAIEEVSENEDSFLRIDKPEINFLAGAGDDIYEKAGEIFLEMCRDGRFIQDESKCFYIYELTMNGHVQTGLVALVSSDDYEKGVIKRHENTLEAKELDRVRHIRALGAESGLVYLAYSGAEELTHIMSESKLYAENSTGDASLLYDFTRPDGVRHRVFRIDDESLIEKIKAIIKDVGSLYICDGHHRAAAAVRNAMELKKEGRFGDETGYFPAALFPASELRIMDYNRVVKMDDDMDPDELLVYLMDKCSICPVMEFGGFKERESSDPREAIDKKHHDFLESTVRPDKKGQFSLYIDGRWYRCEFKEKPGSDPAGSIDTARLQNDILSPIFGIDDPRNDERIDFIGGIKGIEEVERLVDEGEYDAGFIMYPTKIRELMAVADAKELMPPKSTWFEPKLLSGLFIHKL